MKIPAHFLAQFLMLCALVAPSGAGGPPPKGHVSKAVEDASPTADEQQAAAALKQAGHIVQLNERQIPIGLTVAGRGKPLTDQTMTQVHKLVHLEKLFLCNVLPVDRDLANLKSLARLNDLGIGYSREKLSEQDMAHIGGLTGLRRFNVTVPVSDSAAAHILKLPNLEMLNLANPSITDAALVHIARCAKLKELGLARTKITDAGLAQIQGMKSLEKLRLGSTAIGDHGVEKLAGLTQLRELNLAGTQVTDAGLDQLRGLTSLKRLDLANTQVTDAGVQRLKQRLPDCKIIR